MKPRTCPNCKTIIPIDHGFSYDVDLNMVCENCGKVVISTDWAKEPIISPYTTRPAGYQLQELNA